MTEKTLMQRLGPEALVTLTIAVLAVGAATIAFKTHVTDFENVTKTDIVKLEARIQTLEEHDRRDFALLSRVDTRTEHLSKDLETIKKQMNIILQRLPAK